MEHLTKESFKKKIFDFENNNEWNFIGNKPAVIDFYADWCGPCKMIGPILEELETEYTDVNFYKVDVDKNPDLSGVFRIQSIPTILFIPSEGNPQKILGALPKPKLEEILKTIL